MIVKLFPPHDTQNKNNIIIIRTALVSSVFPTFLCSSKTVQTTDYTCSYWICTVRNTVSRIFKTFFSHRMRTLKVVIMDLGIVYLALTYMNMTLSFWIGQWRSRGQVNRFILDTFFLNFFLCRSGYSNFCGVFLILMKFSIKCKVIT